MSLSKIMTEARQMVDIEEGLQKLTYGLADQMRRELATDQYYAYLRVQQCQNHAKMTQQVERDYLKHHLRNKSEVNA